MALSLGETLDHQHRGQPELAARERPAPRAGHGHRPGRHLAAAQLLAGGDVDHRDRSGEHRARAQHRARAHPGAVRDDAAAPDEAVVPYDHRLGLGRLQHATDSHAARQVDVGSDLGAGTYRGPRVHHGVGPHVGPDVDVAGHHDDSGRLVAPPPRRGARHHPHPAARVVALERDLVGELERAELDRAHPRCGEQQQNGLFAPLVDHHGAVVEHLGHPGLPGVEGVDGLMNGGNDFGIIGVDAGAAGPQLGDA